MTNCSGGSSLFLNWAAEKKGEDEGGLLPSYRFSREFSLNSARITFSEGAFPFKKSLSLDAVGRHFTSFPHIIAKPPHGGRELSFREAVLP